MRINLGIDRDAGRKRVILCSLGFLGAANYLYPTWKVGEAPKHIEGETGRNVREQRWSWWPFKPGSSHSWSQPTLWICQLYKLTTSFAVWSAWERLLAAAPWKIFINITVIRNINTFHWTTTSFRSLRSALLNSISQALPSMDSHLRWEQDMDKIIFKSTSFLGNVKLLPGSNTLCLNSISTHFCSSDTMVKEYK